MDLSLSPLLFASLCSSAIHKASSDNHFAVLLLFFFGMVLFATSCTIFRTSVQVQVILLKKKHTHTHNEISAHTY